MIVSGSGNTSDLRAGSAPRGLAGRVFCSVLGLFTLLWMLSSDTSAVTKTAASPIALSFGLYTSNKPSTMIRNYRPIVDRIQHRLAAKLGNPVKIRIQLASDYEQGIQHLASGKVDFSRFGPAAYIEARASNPGLQILALESVGDSEESIGLIVTRLGSNLANVAELEGQSFAFADQQSTVGRYLAQRFLLENGITSRSFSRYDYLGRHDTVGTSVAAGNFSAGAMDESTFYRLKRDGVELRELARFAAISHPWIARSGLSDEVFNALRECLLEMRANSAIDSLELVGFEPGSDASFAGLRSAIRNNFRFFTGPKLTGEPQMRENRRRILESSIRPDTAPPEYPANSVVGSAIE